jgi:carbamoyl-phosphate synthase small subunit
MQALGELSFGNGPKPSIPNDRTAILVLADGSVFEGTAIGAVPPGGVASGEVVFNTVLTGYQEVITDPSYAGQIITFTNPHIGNYGVNATDFESRRPFCRGIVVREMARRASNRRAEGDLEAMLVRHGIPGITGIDTRRLTRLIRDAGAIPGAFGTADEATLHAAAVAEPGTAGIDLVAQVTTPEPYTVGTGDCRIVAYDFGIKRSILRHLAPLGTIEVVPASTPAAEMLARQPDGVFLSNGPGDPAEVPYAVDAIAGLLGEVPIFGICLGHQLLARAVGAGTVKLPFGHHGGNHPVQDTRSGRIAITSQNHNFAVDADSLPAGVELTHVNLNDGVCEGLAVAEARAFCVQHHPEAGPGPHDSTHLFDEFAAMLGVK